MAKKVEAEFPCSFFLGVHAGYTEPKSWNNAAAMGVMEDKDEGGEDDN